ncbi:MAG: hypothetical protein WD029_08355 [Microthrixaceae bacterium]
MITSRTIWTTRVLWLTLPITLGDCVATAAAQQPKLVVWVCSLTMWLLWGIGLLCSFVLSPLCLTVLRICAPLPLLFGIVALVISAEGAPSLLGSIGLATGVTLILLTSTAELGDGFVNGSAYGEERRMALRPAAALLLGPIQLVWALTVAPILGSLWMFALGEWLGAALLAAIGSVTLFWGFRTLYRLSQRWVVFVPAGLTLVDPSVLAEPTLFRRDTISRLGPAPAESSARDLSSGSSGLILQIDLSLPAPLLPISGRNGIAEPIEVSSVLIAPSRPGALLTEAQNRKIAVQRN